MFQPPIAVINSPAGIDLARAAIIAWTSLIESSRFQSRIVARTNPQQHNVIVIIDQPGRHGSPAQVDGPGARAGAYIAIAADRRESALLDDDLGYDGVLPVHSHDLAVGEMQIARAGAAGGVLC